MSLGIDIDETCSIQDADTSELTNLSQGDELIEVNFLGSEKFTTKNQDIELTAITDALKDCHYKFSLEAILKEREETKENAELLKQMDMELMEKENDAEELLQQQDDDDGIDMKNFSIPEEVKHLFPSITIFQSETCFKLYQNPTPPQYELCSNDMITNILSRIPLDCFSEFVLQAHLDHHPLHLLRHPELLSYIYHLLASHPSKDTICGCYKILSSVQKFLLQNTASALPVWSPSLKDVVASLVNCGALFSRLLPVECFFPFNEDDLKVSNVENTEINSHHKKHVPNTNLQYIVNVLMLYSEVPDAYKDEELQLIVLMCCGMILQKNSVCLLELNYCVAAVLDQISDSYWETNVGEIAYQMLQFSSHHHHMWYVVKEMPYTKRGLQLQKIAAFIAVHKLVGFEMERQLSAVEPMHIITLYQNHLMGKQFDYHWLGSAIYLIEIAVGHEIESTGYNKKILKKMVELMQKTLSKIKDTLLNPESTKVKNMIIRIATRWSLIALNMRLKQKTMFSYTNYSDQVESLPRNQDVNVGAESGNQTDVSTCKKEKI